MRVAWISAGVSSFIAAYIIRDKIDAALYIDVSNQHPDSLRFVSDCQKALGLPVEVLRDTKYAACVDNVITDTRYINGAGGAACTLHLKKRVRQEWERTIDEPITYVWGYDVDEKHRAERLSAASEFANEYPLIERGLTKADCHGILAELGIKRPKMYELGYSNNNCIGCVKGGKGYWNRIRRDFPSVFRRRAKQEREIGRSCIKGCFLDELPEGAGNMSTEVFPECSFACLEVAND